MKDGHSTKEDKNLSQRVQVRRRLIKDDEETVSVPSANELASPVRDPGGPP